MGYSMESIFRIEKLLKLFYFIKRRQPSISKRENVTKGSEKPVTCNLPLHSFYPILQMLSFANPYKENKNA
jgi:hypothetical protein